MSASGSKQQKQKQQPAPQAKAVSAAAKATKEPKTFHALVVRPGEFAQTYLIGEGISDIQKLVGGSISLTSAVLEKYTLFVNDDSMDLQYNSYLSNYCAPHGDMYGIRGTGVFVGESHAGNICSLTENQIKTIKEDLVTAHKSGYADLAIGYAALSNGQLAPRHMFDEVRRNAEKEETNDE